MNDYFFELMQRIASADSMTECLRDWCDAFAIGSGTLRVVHATASGTIPANLHTRAALNLQPGETIRHRRIKLVYGDTELLEADNWYVPERLTEMANTLLEDTDTPFGIAISQHSQTRQTLSVETPDQPHTSREALIPSAAWDAPLMIVRAAVSLEARRVALVEERLSPSLLRIATRRIA